MVLIGSYPYMKRLYLFLTKGIPNIQPFEVQ